MLNLINLTEEEKEIIRERKREYQREYRKKNREKNREYHRRWKKDNPEKVARSNANYWLNKDKKTAK